MKSFNFLLAVCFLFGALLIQTGCRSTEPAMEPVEAPEPEPVPVVVEDDFDDMEEEVVEEPETIESLNTVSFGFDLDTITNQAAQRLGENVTQLRENSGVRVRIDAYTDHIGGDQYNLRLSLRRANSVMSFYTANGISEDRIDARGLGKHPVPCTPAQMDSDTPGCVLNRIAESHPIAADQFAP